MLKTTANEIIIVFTQVPDIDCAHTIAQALVEAQLAACVNISSPVTSIYRWQGQIEHASEIGLTIKTTQTCYGALASLLQRLHPYELPEIVAIHACEGLPAYLNWVAQATTPLE